MPTLTRDAALVGSPGGARAYSHIRKYRRRLGTSSSRRAFDTPSMHRQLPGKPHLIPRHHCGLLLVCGVNWRQTNSTGTQRVTAEIHIGLANSSLRKRIKCKFVHVTPAGISP